jgi:NADPH:quinone reductase-like Zn-dependent oxidoreductase
LGLIKDIRDILKEGFAQLANGATRVASAVGQSASQLATTATALKPATVSASVTNDMLKALGAGAARVKAEMMDPAMNDMLKVLAAGEAKAKAETINPAIRTDMEKVLAAGEARAKASAGGNLSPINLSLVLNGETTLLKLLSDPYNVQLLMRAINRFGALQRDGGLA